MRRVYALLLFLIMSPLLVAFPAAGEKTLFENKVTELEGRHVIAIQTILAETDRRQYSYRLQYLVITVFETDDMIVVDFYDLRTPDPCADLRREDPDVICVSVGGGGFWGATSKDGRELRLWSITA